MPSENGPWVKAYSGMMTHPKVVELCEREGPVGVLFYVSSLLYSRSRSTGGRIYPRDIDYIDMPSEVSRKDRLALARRFVELNLWDDAGDNGYVIHNWHRRQGSYKDAGQDTNTYERPAWLRTESTDLGITSGSDSGSEVSVRNKDNLSFFLSPSTNSNNRAGNNTGASARQRGAPTHARGDRLCKGCGLPHGLHTEDCEYRTGPVGLGTFESGPSPQQTSEGPSRRCPSCGVGWGIGHAEGCEYDSKRPLLTTVKDSDNLPRAMDNSGRARALRQRLRDGSLRGEDA